MLIALIGPRGSCKQAVAVRLAKDLGFIVEREEPPHRDGFAKAFNLQLEWMIRRWRLQRGLQKRASEEDLVQIRTFWDTDSVYTESLYFRGHLSDDEHHNLGLIHDVLAETLEPPHAVIYLRASKALAENRVAVTGKPPAHEEDDQAIAELYDRYVKEIRVSVIEVDVVEDFEQVIGEVKSAIEGIRASGMMNQSIWSRGFMK